MQLGLYGTNSTYDLTAATLSNISRLNAESNETIIVNSAVAAQVASFIGNSGTLTTSAATLDLTHSTVCGLQVTSSNATHQLHRA